MAGHDPTKYDKLARQVRQAKGALRIVAGKTNQGFGEPVPDSRDLRVSGLAGVTHHEPSELYVIVGATTRMDRLRKALAKHGQELAADVPGRGPATIGGAIACGVDGPRRLALGAMRDHLLGCRLLDGSGNLLSFGGNLIKNVAGYDVSRLQVGAMGTLGVLVELSLRVRKQVPTITLVQECTAHEAKQVANAAVAHGHPVTASAWFAGLLRIRLEGDLESMRRARSKMGGDEDSEDSFWEDLRDRQLPCFAKPGPVWLCQVPATTEMPHDDLALIDWHGGRRWYFADAPTNLRAEMEKAGGSAVLYRRDEQASSDMSPVFASPSQHVVDLHARLKAVFDPRNILNPGRRSYI